MKSNILFLLVILLCSNVFALDADFDQPIFANGDRAFLDHEKGVMVYEKNVSIIQGSIKISADKIVIISDKVNGGLISITATGNPVKFQQKMEKSKKMAYGSANKITYEAQKYQILLSGNSSLQHDGASFSGETLRYSLKFGDIEGTGSKTRRVQLVIPPNSTRKALPVRNQD